MIRNRLVFVGVALLQLMAFGCGGSSAAAGPTTGTVTIAHLADLTGPVKDANKFQIEGMNIALNEINSDPNQKVKIRIVRQDTTGDVTKALALMKGVASDNQYVLQIGPPTSTEFFAAVPQAAALKMPTLSIVAGGVYSGTFNSYIFRTSFPDASSFPALIDYAKTKLHAKTVGAVYANDQDSPRSNGEAFNSLAAKAGLKTYAYSVSDKDVDFSAQVTKMAADKADVLFISVLPHQLGFLLKAMKAANVPAKLLSGGSVFAGDLKQIYKDANGGAEGVVIATAFDSADPRPVVQNYVKTFGKLYPEQSISFDVYGYDGLKVIAQALNKVDGPVTRESLRRALAKVNYDGLTGTGITFPTGYGDVSRKTVNLKVFTAPGVYGPNAT